MAPGVEMIVTVLQNQMLSMFYFIASESPKFMRSSKHRQDCINSDISYFINKNDIRLHRQHYDTTSCSMYGNCDVASCSHKIQFLVSNFPNPPHTKMLMSNSASTYGLTALSMGTICGKHTWQCFSFINGCGLTLFTTVMTYNIEIID